MSPDEILRDIRAAKAELDRIEDDGLRALGMAAAASGAAILPSEFAPRPTILLPPRMYARLKDLFPKDPRHAD